MKVFKGVLIVFIILGFLGCSTIGKLFEEEMQVPLSEVPTPVLIAAKGAVENIILTKAKIKEEDGQTVYELEGISDGRNYEIDVNAAGRVLEINNGT